MLFKAKSIRTRPLPLKPFLLKLSEGYLLGLAMDAENGAPCVHCIELWLVNRRVWSERAELRDLRVRRELIAELIEENSPHTFYEICNDGTSTRLDVLVFPHPSCSCRRDNYVAPESHTRKLNYAFTPIFQLKSGRFGTPEGNLWLTAAVGECPVTRQTFTVHGVGHEKETSRQRAVDEWLRRATLQAFPLRLTQGERPTIEVFQSGATELYTPVDGSSREIAGVGATREAATLEALFHWAKARTLKKYAAQMKNPMLMVGANNWIRSKVPFFLLQEYDLHLLFYPNSTPAWVVGVAAFSRTRVDEKPIFVFSADSDIVKAMDQVIFKTLEALRPSDWREEGEREVEPQRVAKLSKLNLWWTHWIYRCPKISLREVLHLEAYPRTLEHWRDFLRDGIDPVKVVPLNHELLPSQIRYVVRLEGPVEKTVSPALNVNGIGVWKNFEDALV